MRSKLGIGLSVCLLLCLCACGVSRNWPIPKLTLPSGCTPAPFPSMMRQQDKGDFSEPTNIYPNENSSSWGKAFNFTAGWEMLVSDIDGKLRGLGYTDYDGPEMNPVKGVPGIDAKQLFRAWIAPDGKYKVALVNFGYLRAKNPSALDGADYGLIIDLAKL